jgi:ADP-ribose pyrophosphatase YjhB (NUDIX family)
MGNKGDPWPPRIVACVGAVVLGDASSHLGDASSHGERVLWVRQAKGHSLAGQWSIPWGLVDPGESPEAAAVRETLEEGGIVAEVEGLLGVQNLRREGWVAFVFLCRSAGGVPAHDGGVETDGAAFFTLQEMDAFGEPFEPWCAWLVRRVLAGRYRLIPPEPENPYRPRLAFF